MYGDPTFTFAYVPSHLHHMVFELVKNSLRAVQDKYEHDDIAMPPIRCVCVCSQFCAEWSRSPHSLHPVCACSNMPCLLYCTNQTS